ncbi:nucleotidyltransferase family protein [Candidatus Micrarchaeota archaeon]|nr:nucleotidyltransferase family protein [Candidatus Micrarchaeota archaeon]MBU1930718.1 nucleotidyltransferase family protein [Candidatus Micrarchaeota archaeon]
MIAFIPVAGYATRLHPVTLNTPKALLQVGQKPMIEHVFEKIAELPGIEKVVIVSNHIFFKHFSDWVKKIQSNTSIPIVLLDDHTTSNENRLGAIGDFKFSIEKEKIDSDVIWVSGDNLFTFSLKEMQQDFESKRKDCVGCFDVKSKEEAKKMGIVTVNSDSKVTGFVEKPANPLSTLASCGIYFYTRETIRSIQNYLAEGNSSDKPGTFLEWLYKKKTVYGFVFDKPKDEWFDIGSLEVLNAVQTRFKN